MNWEKIKVGDTVYVEDWGKSYSTYTSFFEKHFEDFDIEWIINYAYNNNMYGRFKNKKDDCKYKVLYIDGYKILIADVGYNGKIKATYIVDKRVLVPAVIKMTKKEIEEALGYSIEIIEEGEQI